MSFAAFYDANVLIPHEIRDILMISAATRLHAVYWSEGVFEEWLRNATEKNLAPAERVLKFQADLNEMGADPTWQSSNDRSVPTWLAVYPSAGDDR